MTTLKLYNTLTRDKVDFKPIDLSNVRMYVCGPTVYDFAHIGNARPVIVFDVLFRLLRHLYGENHVTYVRNITDVDDKINARALRDFPDLPLNEAIRKVTEKAANQFHEDVKALGCLEPTHEPRATDHIEGMVKIINDLLKRGHAYVATGNEGREVLFAVGSMADYGQLSKRKLEDQQAGARIAVEAHKRGSGDFVLWKESAKDQPGWPATFAEYHAESPESRAEKAAEVAIFGRPGWHIECSAMSQFHLGETFDIHGGGLDLIFPHHENEIAQSRCAHGTDVMANVWMHNGFLQVEGKKMSKSDGNFVTINELLHTDKFGGRKWPGEVLRLAMLMTHYRQPIDFSLLKLAEAEGKLRRWHDALENYVPPLITWAEHARENPNKYDLPPSQELVEALADDLNSHLVVGFLDRAASQLTKEGAPQLFVDTNFVGLNIDDFDQANRDIMGSASDLVEIGTIVNERLAFLAAKDFANADRIRDELLGQGIQLKDGKDAEGNRVTTWEVKR